MTVGIFIQARTSSTRFPGKIYAPLWGKAIIEHVWEAANGAKQTHKALNIIPAFIIPRNDERLKDYLTSKGMAFSFFDCDEDDLMTRYYLAAKTYEVDAVIRITADCPTLPSRLIELMITELLSADYCSNTMFRSYPEGWDIQGCSMEALEWANLHQDVEREHPFKLIDENQMVRDEMVEAGLKVNQIINKHNLIFKHLSVDTEQDLIKLELLKDEGGVWEHCTSGPRL